MMRKGKHWVKLVTVRWLGASGNRCAVVGSWLRASGNRCAVVGSWLRASGNRCAVVGGLVGASGGTGSVRMGERVWNRASGA
jgi:hypothetical protein